MIRTFLDSGVLIAAARSLDRDGERALKFLDDPSRVFLTSPFVHLEVVPKAIFFKKRLERSFYDRYFTNAEWYREVGTGGSSQGVSRGDGRPPLGGSPPIPRGRIHHD